MKFFNSKKRRGKLSYICNLSPFCAYDAITNGGTFTGIITIAGDTDSTPYLLLTICMKNHQTNNDSIELLTNNKCFSVEDLTEQHILQSQWPSTSTATTQTNSTDTRCLL